jgi:hypothetical protein
MKQSDTLIRTKLRLPSIRQGLVSRPRIHEKLTQGLRGPRKGIGRVAACRKNLPELLDWIKANRYIRLLTNAEKIQYHIEP